MSTTGTILDITGINCTFDYNRCGWKNGFDATMDWVSQSGPTSSSRTGPLSDHTTGHGQYLYLEASSPHTVGDHATIEYDFFAPVYSGCFSLYYHMYGADVGTLTVSGLDLGGYKNELWAKSEHQGNKWLHAMLPIRFPTTKLLVTAFRGDSYLGDIAIDDITFSTAPCQGQLLADLSTATPLTTPKPTTKGLPAIGAPPSCNFDNGLCGWVQYYLGDDFNWILRSGKTPTFNTGPSKDHTSGSGQYLYIEASRPRRFDDLASICYQLSRPIAQGCLSIFYHMSGVNIGTLEVIVRDPYQTPTKLWSVKGEQENSWKNIKINITQQTSVLEINGVIGDGVAGDIAIDDIQFDHQPCSGGTMNQGPQLVKRLEFEAVYHTDCGILNNAVSKEMLLTSAKSHTEAIRQVCAGDCSVPTPLSPQIFCESGYVKVKWSTDNVYKASTSSLPAELKQRLREKIRTLRTTDFKIIVSTRIPPFVYPKKSVFGEPVAFVLATECADGSRYNKALNTCGN